MEKSPETIDVVPEPQQTMPKLTDAERKELNAFKENGSRLMLRIGEIEVKKMQLDHEALQARQAVLNNDKAYIERLVHIYKSHGVDGEKVGFDPETLTFRPKPESGGGGGNTSLN